jgi:hypothetical protein
MVSPRHYQEIKMKQFFVTTLFGALLYAAPNDTGTATAQGGVSKNPDLILTGASVTYVTSLDLLVFEQKVQGKAGATTPTKRGQTDGAPVLGYVFVTTLKPEDVGFSPTDGILALAVASHPDFDDTPLWDENNDGNYANDGQPWHTHWVVLIKDARVSGGYSVKEFKKAVDAVVLPPTSSGMPMYMDSPGYSVLTKANTLKVIVPAQRVSNNKTFKFDALTAYMEVSAPSGGHDHGDSARLPMLGVYEVYSVLSGKLSLPYTVQTK